MAKAKAPKKDKFPTTLFVKAENDWWNAEPVLDELAEGGKKLQVGIYDLREVRVISMKVVLE